MHHEHREHHSHPEQIFPATGTLHTRREFLRTSMLGAATAWTLPLFLERTFGVMDALAADSAVQQTTGKDGPILIVLQLAGGNDGLNTVVPYSDDIYHSARPSLRIPAETVLRIDDRIGLNPELAGFKSLYDEGLLAIVQGVGYPNPNRSHFRSTEIWQTASDANVTESRGWIGRYFDNCCQGADPTVGLAVGNNAPQAFVAETPTGVVVSDPEQYRWNDSSGGTNEAVFRELNSPGEPDAAEAQMSVAGGSIGELAGSVRAKGDTLEFLQRTALDAQLSSDKIREIAKKAGNGAEYPRTRLGANLGLIGKMIAGGLPSRVYYASQGGYDTHNGQAGTHDRLLSELNDAVCAFLADMKVQGNLGRVVLMTFSEFGRRVKQNGSNGTDHGAAAPLFVAGGGVKPGVYGEHPSLDRLRDGDLMFNIDFRSVYSTVLSNWLNAPSEKVLGRAYPHLPFIRPSV